jgi:Na+/proline symporter
LFRAIWIFGIGHIIIKLLSVYNGLIIFGKYETCDPIYEGKVSKFDQIFPYYVMDVARSIPGLPGMFVVGVFSAALSSASSVLNILSGTAYEDFVKPFFPDVSDQKASHIMKLIVVVVGSICLVMVMLIEKLGSVFSIGISMSSITYGTLLGLFTLGMVSPVANAKVGKDFFAKFSKLIFLCSKGCSLGLNCITCNRSNNSNWWKCGNFPREIKISNTTFSNRWLWTNKRNIDWNHAS